jgi:ABC-type sulfate transport system permease component
LRQAFLRLAFLSVNDRHLNAQLHATVVTLPFAFPHAFLPQFTLMLTDRKKKAAQNTS